MASPPLEATRQMREAWQSFAVWEPTTTVNAPALIKAAGVTAGQRVLDVGTGTGVVAITAARHGATVTGVDPTPELLAHAHENARIAGTDIAFHEADAEHLPFADDAFDVVLSHFGHMFAPHADRAAAEMLRVLRRGGTLAFTAWPPNDGLGAAFEEIAAHLPAPPEGTDHPEQWGEPEVVRARLGARVRDLQFETRVMLSPALSLAHFRLRLEQVGPGRMVAQSLPPEALARFRRGIESSLALDYLDNVVHLRYLLVCAVKA